MSDPIADLLTRIRNAIMARKNHITIPHSGIKSGILEVLQQRGFIESFETTSQNSFKEIKIYIDPQKRTDLTLKRLSKPGQRIYIKSNQLKKVHGGLGIAILSTSHGIISGEEAKKLNMGGELLCEIY